MTFNLGSLLERTYRELHEQVFDGLATGGSTTTIVDSAIATKYVDNRFKGWVAFDSSSNQYAVITSNVNSTGTITFPAITTAVVANDQYSIVNPTIPLNTMIKLVNDALKMLGRIWYIDTTLSTPTPPTLNTRNYALIAATKGMDLRSMYLLDANNYRYDAPNYDILPAAAGTATDTLQFKSLPLTSKTIVINYLGYHPALTAYNSNVSEKVPDTLIVRACVERAFNWKKLAKRKKIDVENWTEAETLYQEALRMYPIQRPPKAVQRVPVSMYNQPWLK